MDRSDCKTERFSSRFMGLILIPLALFIGLIGFLIVPVLGVFFALPLLILAGAFLTAPHSKVCRLILEKRH